MRIGINMGQQTDIRICEQIIIQIVANQTNDLFTLVFLFHKREQQNSAILNFALIWREIPRLLLLLSRSMRTYSVRISKPSTMAFVLYSCKSHHSYAALYIKQNNKAASFYRVCFFFN